MIMAVTKHIRDLPKQTPLRIFHAHLAVKRHDLPRSAPCWHDQFYPCVL